MADIFISYSRRDSEQALSLAERLRASGMTVWIDQHGIEAATSWSKEIVSAIKGCKAFCLLLSDYSLASGNVIKETSLASEFKRTIVPIELHAIELSDDFHYQLAGLQRTSIHNMDAILHALEKYRGSGTDFSPSASPEGTEARSTMIRIAVLPFEDQSPAHDNEWFSDGLTDELISTLNKLDALFVLDRKSSKIYKDAKMTVKQIAHELNVRYIVTGAVRKAGEKLRIQASLIEAASGATLWDEKFSGTMDDIFEIQDKTAFDICEGLKLKLTPEETMLLEEKLTSSPEAFELFMKAKEAATVENDQHLALELLAKALSLHPDYLPALHMISITYSNIYRNTQMLETKWHELEKETIKRIMQIDPKSYYSYGPRANYYLNMGETELALEMAKKMVELQPKKVSSYNVLGFVAHHIDDHRTAIFAFEKVIELDPTNTFNNLSLFISLATLGDYERCAALWVHAKHNFAAQLIVYSENVELRSAIMICAEIVGDYDVVSEQLEYLLALEMLDSYNQYEVSGILSRHGRIEEARDYLRKAIDGGHVVFSPFDVDWFISLKGTPEYNFIVEHVGNTFI